MNHKVNSRHIVYNSNQFISIHKNEIDKLEYNKDWYTTLKITRQWFVFNFPTIDNKNYYYKEKTLTQEDLDNMY